MSENAMKQYWKGCIYVSMPDPFSLFHKIIGMVTNRDMDGEELIHRHRQRCGKSEQAHGIMKHDLAGGKQPSGDFGVNAAWWWIMAPALNLNEIMKKIALGGSWVPRRMKAIRFALINLPGRIITGGRQLKIRIANAHPCFSTLMEARRRIFESVPEPSGWNKPGNHAH